jgi:hypothetical protein
VKRAYYTDPLAAAWMAKHFGMRFQRQIDWGEPFIDITLCDILDSIYESDPYRSYIHPDSLHLLESDPATDLTLYGIADVIEMRRPWANRILQRDGKPFFWPEFEA